MTISLDNMDNGQLLELRDAIDQKLRDSGKSELIALHDTEAAIMLAEGWVEILALTKQTFVTKSLNVEMPLKVEVKLYTFPGSSLGSLDHDMGMVNDNHDDLYDSVDEHADLKSQLATLELSCEKLKKAILEFADKHDFDKDEVWDCVTDTVD